MSFILATLASFSIFYTATAEAQNSPVLPQKLAQYHRTLSQGQCQNGLPGLKSHRLDFNQRLYLVPCQQDRGNTQFYAYTENAWGDIAPVIVLTYINTERVVEGTTRIWNARFNPRTNILEGQEYFHNNRRCGQASFSKLTATQSRVYTTTHEIRNQNRCRGGSAQAMHWPRVFSQ